MTPLLRPGDITKQNAPDVIDHFIYQMSMSEQLDNATLCFLTAVKISCDALKEKNDKEAKHEHD